MTVMEKQSPPLSKEPLVEPHSPLTLHQPKRLIWLALALGWSVDILFYGKAVGISLLLFTLLATVSLGIVVVCE